MREGVPSTRHPHLGVRILSLGPHSPVPGERLQIVIYDQHDNIVRRLEQITGACVDDGYVDFFNSPRCRPARCLHPIVDIAPDGAQTTLHPDFQDHMVATQWLPLLAAWVAQHGVPQPEP